jgi:hypothetical protein
MPAKRIRVLFCGFTHRRCALRADSLLILRGEEHLCKALIGNEPVVVHISVGAKLVNLAFGHVEPVRTKNPTHLIATNTSVCSVSRTRTHTDASNLCRHRNCGMLHGSCPCSDGEFISCLLAFWHYHSARSLWCSRLSHFFFYHRALVRVSLINLLCVKSTQFRALFVFV